MNYKSVYISKYMKNYKENFKGKKVTVMGLGLLGGLFNDIKFLLECGADLIITDLKSEEELAFSVKKLKKLKNISGHYELRLGGHRLEDFKDRDFILQPGNVPPDSPYLLEAQRNNIPIHESESLFFANLPVSIKTIGITGTRGKTTTTRLIYEILKEIFGQKVHLAGNIQGKSTLALLKKMYRYNHPVHQNGHPSLEKAGISGKPPATIVVMELDSWCLHGMGEIKKSPNIAVFTNLMLDHLNFYLKGTESLASVEERQEVAMQKYFTDKAQIYLHQNKDDYLICGEKISKKIGKTVGIKVIANKNIIPKGWKIKILGEHNLENIAYAVSVARVLKIDEKIIKKVVESFGGVEGRLQFLREYKGIKIYNDTTATTPEALEVALKSLSDIKKKGKLITISGGSDKKLNNKSIVKSLNKYADYIFLLNGSGTEVIKDAVFKNFKDRVSLCDSMKKAVTGAVHVAKRGDIIVLSPGFASFGMFQNEYHRGEEFIKIINKL